LKQVLLGALFVSAFGITSQARCAVISPDADTTSLFRVMQERGLVAGADPRMDPQAAVQTSYFEFREANRPATPAEAPFAPEMPPVAPREQAALPVQDVSSSLTRR